MPIQQPPFAALFVLSAAVATVLAGFAIRRRDKSGAIPLALILSAGVLWSIAYLLELAFVGIEVKLFWWQVKYLGIVVIPAGWLVFALEYSGLEQWVTRRTVALLSIVPVVQLAVIWTNRSHHLYVSRAGLTDLGTFTRLVTPAEPGFWLFAAYHYVLLLLGAVVFVRLFLVADDIYRGQAIALLIGVVAPFATNAIFLFGLIPSGVDFTPVAFTVTGVAFTWAAFRHDLLDMVPVTRELAREELIDSIADATFVVDEQRRVVDLNPAARELVPSDPPNPLGQPIGRVIPEIADLFEEVQRDEPVQRKVEITHQRRQRHFDVRVSSLARGYGVLRGHIVVMRDITNLERHRQRLEVMNRVLRHDIRNDVNLILAFADEALDGSGDVEDRLERIKSKALEITALGDNARVLERTRNGEAAVERIDLVPLVLSYVEEVRRDYPDVDIDTRLPDEAVVHANPLIESALKNLVENAIEHNDQPSPRIRLEVRAIESDGLVELRVEDDGPGIPTRERQVIERGTETNVHHSSGLGLWLVNWIVTDSGGEVRFTENTPRGTVTTVTLNAADGDGP